MYACMHIVPTSIKNNKTRNKKKIQKGDLKWLALILALYVLHSLGLSPLNCKNTTDNDIYLIGLIIVLNA